MLFKHFEIPLDMGNEKYSRKFVEFTFICSKLLLLDVLATHSMYELLFTYKYIC